MSTGSLLSWFSLLLFLTGTVSKTSEYTISQLGFLFLLANNKCFFSWVPAVKCAILTSWRVCFNVRCLDCCITRGRWNTGCMNQ